MNRTKAFRASVLLSCAVLLAACGGGGSKASDSSSTTEKGGPGTTGSTAPTGPTAILTGLPLADVSIHDRPLLTVKIDNSPQARPQFGIDRADNIIEEKVEGGLSRWMALFQSEDVDRVGPVRSLRTTDVDWLKGQGGMIAYSGGIPPVRNLLPGAGVVDIGADTHGSTYYKRRSDRPFEHSMYTITPVLRTLTPKGTPAPRPMFSYLSPGEPFGGTTAAPITSVSLRMDAGATATYFDWTWNPQTGTFMRGTEGKAHMIEGVGQISMKNVIVQFTSYSPTPWRDRAGSVSDKANVVGSGDAWILSEGKIVKGRWSRPSENDITAYTDATGATVKVQPGHSWVSLVPPGQPYEVR